MLASALFTNYLRCHVRDNNQSGKIEACSPRSLPNQLLPLDVTHIAIIEDKSLPCFDVKNNILVQHIAVVGAGLYPHPLDYKRALCAHPLLKI